MYFLKSRSKTPFQKTGTDQSPHRLSQSPLRGFDPLRAHQAQMTWSLCVAAAIAIFVVQQTMISHRHPSPSVTIQDDSSVVSARAPQTLVTGKPVPLSQEDLKSTESVLQ